MQAPDLPQFKDVPWRWIAYTASVFVIAALAFGFVHQIELKQDVSGEIVSAAEVKIQGLTGLVSSISVRPSERVEAGTPLFRLQRDFSLTSDGQQRQVFDEKMRDSQIQSIDEQYRERRAQLVAQRQSSRLTESSRQAELAALGTQSAQNTQLIDESEQRLARLNSVAEYVTADKIEQARVDVHQGRITAAQNSARKQQLSGEIGAAVSAQADIDAQMRELDARHARDVQDVRARFERDRQDAIVSAPKSGIVTFSGLVAGRTLTTNDVAMVIATGENGPLRAALSIPSRRRGFVREGQIVRLKFDAFPYAKFGTYEARIDSISGTTVLPASPPTQPGAPGGADPADETTAPKETGGDYLAWATLSGKTFDFEGQHFAILPGMRATASIVVERRTIAEWVLAPLFRMLRG
jgi:membrane fusion protein